MDHDLMVHCHWEFDLRTSIQLAEAVESIGRYGSKILCRRIIPRAGSG